MAAPALSGVAVLTLAEARALVSDQPIYTGLLDDDTTVQRYIDAATTVVEGIAGPIVVQKLSTSGDGGGTNLPLPWPVLTDYDMTLTESGVLLTYGTDYRIDIVNWLILPGQPPNGLRWFQSGFNNIQFTAWAGRDINVNPVPAALKSAVAEEFRFLWQMGQQQSRGSWGGDLSTTADWAPSGFAVPHRVIELAQFASHIPGFA